MGLSAKNGERKNRGGALSLAAFLPCFFPPFFALRPSKALFTRTQVACYPGFPRDESPRRVTLLQSVVYNRLHEISGQGGSAPLAGYVETRVDPARRVEISSVLTCKQWAKS